MMTCATSAMVPVSRDGSTASARAIAGGNVPSAASVAVWDARLRKSRRLLPMSRCSAGGVGIGCGHERAGVAGLEGGMTGIRDDVERGLGPSVVQIPGTAHRTDHVVAPLHDGAGNLADALHIVEQLCLALEEAIVDEV